MTVTGTVVTSSNYDTVTNKLFGECARSSLSFDFSADLCDALDTCYDLWYERWRPGQQSPRMPWRQASLPDNIVVKEAINPKDSNYDGRNFIGE
jgi:hypothetical protein